MSASSPEPDASGRFISYSINYEDVLLRRMFPGRTDGFFIDVGAEHPRLGNDFYGLYMQGWRGINIEPSPEFFRMLEEHRPHDRNLQVALSDVNGQELAFFEVHGTGLSTCDEKQAEACAAEGYTVTRHDVRTSTLAEILNDIGPPHIDIMKVDVEGLEEQVLLGNNWEAYRPSIIMVEATYPRTPTRRPTNIRHNLEAAGYRHIHFDNLNDFYAERSFVVPPGATMPPNVFDNFVRWDSAALADENASMRANFAEAETYAHSLEKAQAETEKQNRHLLEGLRRSEATSQFVRKVAVASVLNRADQVRRMLVPGPLSSTQENSKGQAKMPEQGKELVAVPEQNALNVSEQANPNGESVPVDVRLELLNAQLHALATENNRLANDIKDLVNENRRLLNSTNHLQGENLTLRRTLGPTQALNEELTRILSRIEADVQRINAEVGPPFRSDLQARLDQLIRMQAHGNEVSKLLQAVYQSTSWRLTRPVRAMGRIFKS